VVLDVRVPAGEGLAVHDVCTPAVLQLPEDVLTREVDAMVQKDKITTEELRVLDERMQALAQELGWSPENDDAPSSDADALDDLVSEVNALPASPGGRPSTSQALGSSTGMLGISLSLSQLMPITEGSVWGSWSEQANMLPGPKTRNNMNKTGGDSTRRDEWAVLAKYDEMAAAEEQRKRKEDAVKAQAEMRAFLTSQMQKRDVDASTRKAEEEHWAAQFSVGVLCVVCASGDGEMDCLPLVRHLWRCLRDSRRKRRL
jgi:hypothetical protein